jgi:[ribosomal protein S5]-alanine N-acetyltransferase
VNTNTDALWPSRGLFSNSKPGFLAQRAPAPSWQLVIVSCDGRCSASNAHKVSQWGSALGAQATPPSGTHHLARHHREGFAGLVSGAGPGGQPRRGHAHAFPSATKPGRRRHSNCLRAAFGGIGCLTLAAKAPCRRPPVSSTLGRMNTLHASRCTLEPLTSAHAAELFEALSDPAIYEFEGEPPPSLERLERGLRRREARLTSDGEAILDWAVRVDDHRIAGYVQATLLPANAAYVSYEFASAYWRQGIGSAAVQRMLDDLTATYSVTKFVAVLKSANYRSLGLLRKLGFLAGTSDVAEAHGATSDELTLVRGPPQ